MKLQFKHQKFQADAAKAVVDVFAGQPFLTSFYTMEKREGYVQHSINEEEESIGWRNQPLVPELTDGVILEHIHKIQRVNQIAFSPKLEGRYNLTIEMETGVGKTYTYIKTMYELNRHYGWSKFIVVVPSVAIREGVYQSFQVTQEHFAEEYNQKIRFFIYNSARLTELDRFASDSAINVMIINAQAFNARGKDARRIYMKQDTFRSRRPIDRIARTNPILIIDEPQSVEGKQTKERLKEFNPLFTLRYSATHKADSIYNMVYRLDAMEAYNKKLVKKIAVKGITESGTSATESYVYLEGINLSRKDPTATLQFDCRGASGLRRISRNVNVGYSLYENSGHMEEYKDGFVVSAIDGRDDSVEFLNGIRLYAGDVIGRVSEAQIRRIQIRETILSHIERERQMFHKGIKVLSLFFIDEVAHYRQYNEAGNPSNGMFADMFEEEYRDITENLQLELGDKDYLEYLSAIRPEDTHAGYFSVDKKGKLTDSRLGDRKERTSDDTDAYDLIMKNKELLLERNPKVSPVRFIFSHSALREGWDNPNVFQICTLKQSSSEVRKRQEVGRGLRLCVNQDGERMDVGMLGDEVHNVNVLTVIASESYDSFAKGLQSELAEAVRDRPRVVNAELFKGKVIRDVGGNEQVIDAETAQAIYFDLVVNGYVNKKGGLTDRYYEAKANGAVQVAEEVADSAAAILKILDAVYDEKQMAPEDARKGNVVLKLDERKIQLPEFRELWEKISARSVYRVDFDTDELIRQSIFTLNGRLRVPKLFFRVEAGEMKEIRSKEELKEGASFEKKKSSTYGTKDQLRINNSVKYDLVGKLVEETDLTRKAVIAILTGIEKKVFDQFKENPEEFLIRAAALINEEKAAAVIRHITYRKLDKRYDEAILTMQGMKGRLGLNAMKAEKHLYDHVLYDSTNERDFAAELEADDQVLMYVKLPKRFTISTPVGRYSPDWAIIFRPGMAKYRFLVAETKGAGTPMQLRMIEESKVHCARVHFQAICGDSVAYEVADSYQALLDKVMG